MEEILNSNYCSPGMVEEVIEECETLLQHEESPEIRAVLANAFMNRGSPSDAVIHYKKALANRGDNTRWRLRLGEAYKEMGLYKEALETLECVLACESDWADAHKHLADVYLSMGLLDRALEHYQSAIDINQTYTEANFGLACVLEEMGMLQEALVQYRKMILHYLETGRNHSVDMARAHADLAVFYGKKALSVQAIEHLRMVVTLHPDWPDAQYNLGMALKSRGDYEEAMKYFKNALKLNPRYDKASNAYWECGQIVNEV